MSEGLPHVRGNEIVPSSYDRAAEEKAAAQEVVDAVEERLAALGDPSMENRIAVLEKYIAELSAVEHGTTIPINNRHRHRVEAASKMLAMLEEEASPARLRQGLVAVA